MEQRILVTPSEETEMNSPKRKLKAGDAVLIVDNSRPRNSNHNNASQGWSRPTSTSKDQVFNFDRPSQQVVFIIGIRQ